MKKSLKYLLIRHYNDRSNVVYLYGIILSNKITIWKRANNWSKNKNKEYARITIYFVVFNVLWGMSVPVDMKNYLLIFLFLCHKSDAYNELWLNISNFDIVLLTRNCCWMFASQWCYELSIIFRLLLMIILVLWLQDLLIIVFYVMKTIVSIHSGNYGDELVVFTLLF